LLVEMKNISKRFGEVQALDNVSIEIHGGEVLGLLGENGAGKTTLMNILYGLYKADSGEILIDGKRVRIKSPSDAISHGIFMVHQHFKLIPNFTALENIIIGFVKGFKSLRRIDIQSEKKKIEELMKDHGLSVPLESYVRELPLGVQQRIEILKALYRGAQLLILDEPTTNLTPQESEELIHTVHEMKKRGLSVVFITHKIPEILEAVDRVVVLRKGRVMGGMKREEIEVPKLIEMMVGRRVELEDLLPSLKKYEAKEGGERPTVLKVQNLTITEKGVKVVKNVSFEVRAGEILGIAGVAGNGQRELSEAIYGSRKVDSGKIIFLDEDITNFSPKENVKRGLRFIPEDRLRDGVLPTMSVAENIVLGYHHIEPYNKKSFLDYNAVKRDARKMIKEYDIKTPSETAIAGRLSGGNIQKLMIARSFVKRPKLLIAYTPTRGLDIGMTEKVLKKMIEVRNNGDSVIFVSEDLDQLLLISDRIAVMFKGEIMGVVGRKEFDKEKIGMLMMGIRGDA
jgi:ABC-type uncharacterized transport system ATPase subunit